MATTTTATLTMALAAMTTAEPHRRFRGLPARVLIMCWLLVLMVVVLASVCLVTRNLLRQKAFTHVNNALEQEAQEYRRVAASGVDESTRAKFTSAAEVLSYHLTHQYPDDDEVIVGWVANQVLRQERQGPIDLAANHDLLHQIVTATRSSGVADTAAGDLYWIKVVTTGPAADARPGVYIVGYLIERDLAEVDTTIRTLALVSLAGLVFAGAAAWIVAGRILAPVRLVRQAAAQISEQDLTRRIPVDGNDDIAALADQFNAMLARLEQAFATQREFLDDASHELRTPITIIRGHLELLDTVESDPAERAEVIRLCTDELDRMSRMVDDLLLLAKAERPDFVRKAPVELAELTSDVDAKVRALGPREWRLDGIGTGVVVVDEQRVTQAVVQLAQNAVQHTSPGDRIGLGSSHQDGMVSLWITDTGPGVTSSDLEVIFNRFTSGGRGAGLGLAIVRAIAEAHRGTVRVVSTPGQGATFGIELPAGGVRP